MTCTISTPNPGLSIRSMNAEHHLVSDVTQLLGAMGAGHPQAADQLLPLVYEELRKNDIHVDQRPSEMPSAAETGAALAMVDRSPRFNGIDNQERRIYTVA